MKQGKALRHNVGIAKWYNDEIQSLCREMFDDTQKELMPLYTKYDYVAMDSLSFDFTSLRGTSARHNLWRTEVIDIFSNTLFQNKCLQNIPVMAIATDKILPFWARLKLLAKCWNVYGLETERIWTIYLPHFALAKNVPAVAVTAGKKSYGAEKGEVRRRE